MMLRIYLRNNIKVTQVSIQDKTMLSDIFTQENFGDYFLTHGRMCVIDQGVDVDVADIQKTDLCKTLKDFGVKEKSSLCCFVKAHYF